MTPTDGRAGIPVHRDQRDVGAQPAERLVRLGDGGDGHDAGDLLVEVTLDDRGDGVPVHAATVPTLTAKPAPEAAA